MGMALTNNIYNISRGHLHSLKYNTFYPIGEGISRGKEITFTFTHLTFVNWNENRGDNYVPDNYGLY